MLNHVSKNQYLHQWSPVSKRGSQQGPRCKIESVMLVDCIIYRFLLSFNRMKYQISRRKASQDLAVDDQQFSAGGRWYHHKCMLQSMEYTFNCNIRVEYVHIRYRGSTSGTKRRWCQTLDLFPMTPRWLWWHSGCSRWSWSVMPRKACKSNNRDGVIHETSNLCLE